MTYGPAFDAVTIQAELIRKAHRLPLGRPILDRLLPALFFGILASAKVKGVVQVLAVPDESSLEAWVLRALALGHAFLTLAFTVFLALLFLTRKSPVSVRSSPVAMAVALGGTFIMGLALAQPTTMDHRGVLALSDLLVAAGLAFSIYALSTLRFCFGLAPEARGLMTSGAYGMVRHPVYLGEFVAMFGVLLPVLAPFTVLIFVAFCVLQGCRALLEESVLSATFPDYAAYRLRTPALLPWPRP